MYTNKYSLTVEENIFIAKRNIVDNIYRSARLEGFAITFPDTDAIINGGTIQGLAANEIVTINNLKHAWHFIIENIEHPTNYALICEIHKIVGSNLIYNAGFIRNIPVTIGGTNWTPQLPIEIDIKKQINNTLLIPNETERSISLMLLLSRWQMFLDGNKRTAMLAANHHMIKNGCGIISIPIEHLLEFSKKIIQFYESNIDVEIKKFLYDTSISGLFLNKNNNIKPTLTDSEMENMTKHIPNNSDNTQPSGHENR